VFLSSLGGDRVGKRKPRILFGRSEGGTSAGLEKQNDRSIFSSFSNKLLLNRPPGYVYSSKKSTDSNKWTETSFVKSPKSHETEEEKKTKTRYNRSIMSRVE